MIAIDEFVEGILSIRPNNFMSLNGAGTGIIGASNSGSDALQKVQQASVEFSNAYKSSTSSDILQVAYSNLIGKMMIAMALDVLTEKIVDTLIGQLQQLMEERKINGT